MPRATYVIRADPRRFLGGRGRGLGGSGAESVMVS